MRDCPNDADGDALRRVANDASSNISRPMDIDFCVAAATEAAALAIADAARALGYRSSVSWDEHSACWTASCTRTMLATYEGVLAAQYELDQLARPLGGHIDGWGTLGNNLGGPA